MEKQQSYMVTATYTDTMRRGRLTAQDKYITKAQAEIIKKAIIQECKLFKNARVCLNKHYTSR